MRCIPWFSILQTRKQGSLNAKSRTTDSETYSSHFKLLHLTSDILPLFRQWKKDSITIQYLFPLNTHFSESTAHWWPILPLIPYYHISTKSKPAPALWRESRLTATTQQPGLTSPGRSAADPQGVLSSCRVLVSTRIISESFSPTLLRFLKPHLKMMYVKEPETRGTILNFPCRTRKPSLTEFFPTWRAVWTLRTICSSIL